MKRTTHLPKLIAVLANFSVVNTRTTLGTTVQLRQHSSTTAKQIDELTTSNLPVTQHDVNYSTIYKPNNKKKKKKKSKKRKNKKPRPTENNVTPENTSQEIGDTEAESSDTTAQNQAETTSEPQFTESPPPTPEEATNYDPQITTNSDYKNKQEATSQGDRYNVKQNKNAERSSQSENRADEGKLSLDDKGYNSGINSASQVDNPFQNKEHPESQYDQYEPSMSQFNSKTAKNPGNRQGLPNVESNLQTYESNENYKETAGGISGPLPPEVPNI